MFDLCIISYSEKFHLANPSEVPSTEEQLTVISLFATPSKTSILLSRRSFTVCASRSPRASAVLCRSFVTCLDVRESASIPAPVRNIAEAASSFPIRLSKARSRRNSSASSNPARKSASRSAIQNSFVYCPRILSGLLYTLSIAAEFNSASHFASLFYI